MRQLGVVLCLLTATAVHGQGSVDCGSCNEAAVDRDGVLHCHCDVEVDTVAITRTGQFNLTTTECSHNITVGGVWNGDTIEPRQVNSSSGIELESVLGCKVELQLHNAYFTEEGFHFCPHIVLCGGVDIGQNNALCNTIRRTGKETCLELQDCGACLTPRPGAPTCVWCEQTGTCMVAGAPPNQAVDNCGICSANDTFVDSSTCPPTIPISPVLVIRRAPDEDTPSPSGSSAHEQDGLPGFSVAVPGGGGPATGGAQRRSPRDEERDSEKFKEFSPHISAKYESLALFVFVVLLGTCCCLAVLIRRTYKNRRFINVIEASEKVTPEDIPMTATSEASPSFLPLETEDSAPATEQEASQPVKLATDS